MVSSRLYLNKGQMRFEDITEPRRRERPTDGRPASTMVDINNDGYLDIYVSVSGPEWSKPDGSREPALHQQRQSHFHRKPRRSTASRTPASRLTRHSWTTTATDASISFCSTIRQRISRAAAYPAHPSGMRGETPGSYNELYRNNCTGTFTNVSTKAGILRDAGYGLGVAVADLNGDGWPDIYVSNDVAPNDVLYINNGNGTFTNKRGAG